MKLKVLLFGMLLALCVFPALAQDTSTSAITVNGFSFSLPSAVASNLIVMQVAADPTTLQQPGGPQVKHTEFVLYSGTTIPQSEFDGIGTIHIYNTADFNGYQEASQEVQNLQTLLAQRPDLAKYMVADNGTNANNLPYLPVIGASQVIRARAQYVITPSLSGVSYLTAFRQDVSPFTGDQFRYTFQGLSSDGAHYVAANFNLNTTLFPAQIPANFDENAFGQQLATYLTQSIATLNGATPDNFTPSLTALDTLVQSFSFTGAAQPGNPTQPQQPTIPPPPSATPTDSSMGGLAGVTWTLVSYGDPAAPTAALPDKAVTLVFSGSGVTGNAGCNGYGGSFQFNGNALTISQLVHTMIACSPSTILDQENAYLDALSKATSYQINGTQLQITYDGGVLTFTGS